MLTCNSPVENSVELDQLASSEAICSGSTVFSEMDKSGFSMKRVNSAYWEILQVFFCQLLISFFQNQLFRKILSGILSECQTVWIQIRPNILLSLILVQTVCKGYQQTVNLPLAGKEL